MNTTILNRRSYLAVIGFTTTGCLASGERSEPRPIGEKQHRDNIAMAATNISPADSIEIEGTILEPQGENQFALVEFWAQNLVNSQRTLPVAAETKLIINDTDYSMYQAEPITEWNKLYSGGTVDSGVIRNGIIPFEVDQDISERRIQFTIPPAAGNFDDAVSWALPSSS